MRSLAVIVLSPLFDDDIGLLQAVEDFTIEQLIREAGVEALAVAVLLGQTRRYVSSLSPDGVDPASNLLCDELRLLPSNGREGLSERMNAGGPRRIKRTVGASTTLMELSFRSTWIASASRVNSSMMFSVR